MIAMRAQPLRTSTPAGQLAPLAPRDLRLVACPLEVAQGAPFRPGTDEATVQRRLGEWLYSGPFSTVTAAQEHAFLE